MNKKITLFVYGLITVIISVTSVYLLRSEGILEPYELRLLDSFFLKREEQTVSEDIVLVTITEDDINQLEQYPLSDWKLAQILAPIIKAQPRVIGLDIIRNFAVHDKNLTKEENQKAFAELQTIFRQNSNLYGIAKITEAEGFPSIPGASSLEQAGRLAAADLVLDKDRVARRGNLYPSYNQGIPGLGLAVALKYLEKEGITPTTATRQESKVCSLPQEKGKDKDSDTGYPQEGWLKFGSHVLCPLTPKFGGYVTHSDSGYQILFNWRSCKSSNFSSITLRNILDNTFQPELLKDRIVLIGNTAPSSKDFLTTACSQNTGNTPKKMPGVEIQANLAQQIISIARQESFPISAWKELPEIVWIILWAICLQLMLYSLFRYKAIFFVIGGLIIPLIFAAILYYLDLYFFLNSGIWLPLLPVWLCILLQSVLTLVIFFLYRLQQANETLDLKVKERTIALEQAIQEKLRLQRKMVAQQKLNFVGRNAVSLSHEIRNPLGAIELANLISIQSLENLSSIEDVTNRKRILTELSDNADTIKQNIRRINGLVVRLNEQVKSEDLIAVESNLNEVIDNALDVTVYSFRVRQDWNESVEIDTDYDSNLPSIKLYLCDFERAICNLIDNSLYSLKQKQQNNPNYVPKLSITTKQLESQVELTIEDNGEGIKPEDEKKIFEEFYTTKGDQGTGLGLYIVKEIIEGEHGGKLTLTTKWQEFCRLSITIPTSLT